MLVLQLMKNRTSCCAAWATHHIMLFLHMWHQEGVTDVQGFSYPNFVFLLREQGLPCLKDPWNYAGVASHWLKVEALPPPTVLAFCGLASFHLCAHGCVHICFLTLFKYIYTYIHTIAVAVGYYYYYFVEPQSKL